VTLDACSIAPPWHAHHLFDVLPKRNLSHLSGLKLSPFILSVPDRLSSRLLLAVAMPHSPLPHPSIALCCRPSSRAFSCRCRSPSLASYHLGQYRPRGCGPTIVSFPLIVAVQRVPPCCALPLYPCSWLHLPSVLAGRQVVECCAGPGTLVPRARCEHIVNMGRCGHACVSDLVARTRHKPLSPFFAPALLQFAYPLSPYLALCCEACSTPCARN
jgi:hypothetical protein